MKTPQTSFQNEVTTIITVDLKSIIFFPELLLLFFYFFLFFNFLKFFYWENVVYNITFLVKLFLVLQDVWNKVMRHQRPYRSELVLQAFYFDRKYLTIDYFLCLSHCISLGGRDYIILLVCYFCNRYFSCTHGL